MTHLRAPRLHAVSANSEPIHQLHGRVAKELRGTVRAHILLFAALLTVRVVAHAEDQQCAAARKQAVPASLKVVNEIDAHVEQAPPDEANYLQTEYVAAIKDHNQARYNMLVDRPY
ncbi:hypothetical protein R70006_03782 [Paraburkholderia domus]|nr:hypothetical protein R70006_03782 [Paraburkholderia domus]